MAPSRPVLPPLLARTSSLTSLASSTSSASSSSVASSPTTAQHPNAKRRTRKRITPQQLRMLELLFERDTHPSREDRDALAAELGMEGKSVTIWFQNKRQTARKIALHNATNMHNALNNSSSKNSRSLSAEVQPTVKTERSSSLYDSMPSSPYRVSSPQPADYFHGQRGSLDWACAKDMLSQQSIRTQLSGGETDEDESHEALTPRDVDMDWTGGSAAISPQLLKKEHDEDVMKAALALCGLRG